MILVYIAPFLTVIGWYVVYRIITNNRKQTERLNRINEKNALLAEIDEFVQLSWHPNITTPEEVQKIRETAWKLEKIRKLYRELDSYKKIDSSYETKIGALRRRITLDTDEIPPDIDGKRREIEKIIANLENLPPKF
ncbi:MAG: hypothetical protein HAW59_04690 [Betaproteobacteria bacterium]|nr:hypothetical protein [Betaproteobacteria bacterium]